MASTCRSMLGTILPATTALEQQHGTYTKFDQGSTIGEVKVKFWLGWLLNLM